MPLQRIFMKETADSKHETAKRIRHWLDADKNNQVFYIVPDHIKFDAELSMIKEVGSLQAGSEAKIAMTKLQVFSFTRLAWYLLKDKAIIAKPGLSKVGLAMLVQKILVEYQEELLLFRAEAHHKGFVEQLVDLFQEFRQGAIEPEDFQTFMEAQVDQTKTSSDFLQRLKEFGILYGYFQKELKGAYVQSEELLLALADEILQTDLSHTLVIIDHYYSFRAQEQMVIKSLVEKAHTVDLQITLTRHSFIENGNNPQSLFFSNSQLVKRVSDFLASFGLEIDSSLEILDKNSKYHLDFYLLEDYWLQTSHAYPSGKVTVESQPLDRLHLASYVTKQEEIQALAARIKDKVLKEGYRYKDIQILSRTLDQDRLLLEPILEEFKIPYFLDSSESVQEHPLFQVLESIFAIKNYYWRADNILNLLRTEYCFWPKSVTKEDSLEQSRETLVAFRQMVDTSETIILANGYQGSDWLENSRWAYSPPSQDEEGDTDQVLEETVINDVQVAIQLKEMVSSSLTEFYKHFSQAKTGRQAVTLLYTLLEDLGVDQAILYWRDWYAQNGQVQLARQQEQVWGEFLNILDEYVDLFGQDTFNELLFQQMIQAAFEQISYKMAPSTLDQVLCTGIDSIRFESKKITFAIGLSQGVLPRTVDNTSLFTDEERDLLTQELDSGRFLRPNSSQNQSVEPYVFYKILTSAYDNLYLSYSKTQADSNSLQEVSSYLQRIANFFSVPVEDGTMLLNERLSHRQFKNQAELFKQLLTEFRKNKYQPEENQTEWILLAHLLKNHPDYRESYQKLIASVFRMNIPQQLPLSLANQLYGNNLYLSVSQVELFFADPFSHFLRYGLALKERVEFELTAANAGDYFHESLDLLLKEMNKQGLNLMEISDSHLEELIQKLFQVQDQDARFIILSSSERMKFLKSLLQNTIMATAKAIKTQAGWTMNKPYQTEYVFGNLADQAQSIHVTYPIDDSHSIHLRGKIDRIDQALVDGTPYVTIVDYKSGTKDFAMNQFLEGLQLQLFFYLDIARKLVNLKQGDSTVSAHKQAKPFGAFYVRVQNPTFASKNLENKDYEDLWLNAFRYKGLMINELETIRNIAPLAEDSSRSDVFPFKFKKDGSFAAESKVIDPDSMENMITYVRMCIVEAGRRILNGDTRLAPFDKGYTPSVSGAYASISQFDASNPENSYRKLEQISMQDGLEKIEETLRATQSDEPFEKGDQSNDQ